MKNSREFPEFRNSREFPQIRNFSRNQARGIFPETRISSEFPKSGSENFPRKNSRGFSEFRESREYSEGLFLKPKPAKRHAPKKICPEAFKVFIRRRASALPLTLISYWLSFENGPHNVYAGH